MPRVDAKVFLDAAYAVALSSHDDPFYQQALLLADQLEAARTRLITTQAVILEIGNSLSKQRCRTEAVRLIAALLADPNVEALPLSDNLFTRAFQLYRERKDKEWGLTDCVSFVVMRDRGISEALTADGHFRQAGFCTLLRPE